MTPADEGFGKQKDGAGSHSLVLVIIFQFAVVLAHGYGKIAFVQKLKRLFVHTNDWVIFVVTSRVYG
jgi:hypothetical protein